MCFKGTVDYNYSNGSIELYGRVKKSTSSGTLTIHLKGMSKKNEIFTTYVSANLKGRYSEIFNAKSESYYYLKNRRDIKWVIDSIQYY